MTLKPFTKILCESTWILFTCACTNTVYQGKLEVLNSQGQAEKALVYWTKTEKLIGESKAGPVVLLTSCSTRHIDFEDSADGIVFRGTPGQDRLMGQSGSVAEESECGKIENARMITELSAGPLNLNIGCEALMNDFAVLRGPFSPFYIQARKEPYQFDIQENSIFSLFGTIPEAPKPPDCE